MTPTQQAALAAIRDALPGFRDSAVTAKGSLVEISHGKLAATISPHGVVKACGPGGALVSPRSPGGFAGKLVRVAAGLDPAPIVSSYRRRCGACGKPPHPHLSKKGWQCQCGARNDSSAPTLLERLRERPTPDTPNGRTVEEAAELVGVSPATIRSFERRANPVPMTAEQRDNLALAYELTPAEEVELLRQQATLGPLIIPSGQAAMVVLLPDNDDHAAALVGAVQEALDWHP